MKREIKFRGWDETQKYMAYQGTGDLETLQSFMLHFGDIELMQFTGLKDENGKDIYEGDIIYGFDLLCNINFKGVIEFRDGSYCINQDDIIYRYRIDHYEIEVIGNIHDNPELIDSKTSKTSKGK